MKLRRTSWFGAAMLCGALVLPVMGCGDDTDTSTDTDGGAGTSGSGGKSGSGGQGGTSGKGGSGGSSSALMCGGATCKPNSTLAGISDTKACCTTDNKCGQTNAKGTCLQQNAPGTLDSSCPTVDVDFNGTNYPQMGCCTPKGQCGGQFDQVGYGCVAREDLGTDMGGPLSAMSCGGGADAGMDDAGM